jgi:hypothetical protein
MAGMSARPQFIVDVFGPPENRRRLYGAWNLP